MTRSGWRTSRPPPILRVSFVAVPFRRPFSVRDPHEPGRAATPLELFFDLIFVVAIASNVVQLHHGITEGHLDAVVGYTLAWFAIWWAWMSYTWYASAYDNDDVVFRLLGASCSSGQFSPRPWPSTSCTPARRSTPSLASMESEGTEAAEGTSAQVLEQARAAIDAGATWRARDLLAAHVEADRDPAVLTMLGEVYTSMGDLPRAGAIWFAAGAKGDEVDAAVSAWRAQSRDDFTLMWWSLPASVRVEPMPRRIEALRERARAAGGDVDAEVSRTASDVVGPRPDGPAGEPAAAPSSELTVHPAPDAEEEEGKFDASWFVAWVLAVLFVVFAVIGFVTALGWVVPG